MQITDPIAALRFMLAGRATVTLKSLVSEAHYTYQINAKDSDRVSDGMGGYSYNPREEPWTDWFVKLLTAPEEYTYIGMIKKFPNGTHFLKVTQASKLEQSSKPIRALNFALQFLDEGAIHESLEIYHDGRCGRCRRHLTRPDSINIGIGPECCKVLGIKHPLNCEEV